MGVSLRQEKADTTDIINNLLDNLHEKDKERVAAIVQGFVLGTEASKEVEKPEKGK